MNFTGTLIAVKDMEKSKQFYHDVLGLEVTGDFGTNVTLTGGIFLQTVESWKGFIDKQDNEIVCGNNAGELYFEEDDFDRFAAKLTGMANIQYIHPVKEHSWGQRAVRFYDPDRHIIEVGENIVAVVKRFVATGLTEEETAVRMDVPLDYIRSCLK